MLPDLPRPSEPVVPRPAAAVIALRDGDDGLEVLVGQRTSAARFMGGFWVFPGGQVDPVDGAGDAGFRRAAARELAEEVSVVVAAEALVPFDRWVTPEPFPRRFDTLFFVAAVPEATIRVDGTEIVASRWTTPVRLLGEARADRALLAYPTLRQLEKLTRWASAAEALSGCAAHSAEHGVAAVVVPADAPFRR